MIKQISNFKGYINLKIENKNGISYVNFRNSHLLKGIQAIAKNLIKDDNKIYITHVIFGDGGCENGVKKTVTKDRSSLFGTTRLVKEVFPQIDPDNPTQIVIPFSIEKEEGNDYILNEMAIKLSNGDLLSMATFKDIQKTSDDKLSSNWILEF